MFTGVSFYGATGTPLSLKPAPDGQAGWRAPDGRQFVLWTMDPDQHSTLKERLSEVKSAHGASGLSSIDAVRTYLASVAEMPY
jgi:hypothetical protein